MTPDEQKRHDEEVKRKQDEQAKHKQAEDQKRKDEAAHREHGHASQQPADQKPGQKASQLPADTHTPRKKTGDQINPGHNKAVRHAVEARIKGLEGQIESERKRLDMIEKFEGEDMSGELGHGEEGFIILDTLGAPTGVATPEPPDPGTPAAPVQGWFPQEAETLVTSTGAPIRPIMNPMPDPRVGIPFTNRDTDVDPNRLHRPVVNTPAQA